MKYGNSDMLLNDNEITINMSMTSFQDYSFDSTLKNSDGTNIQDKDIDKEDESNSKDLFNKNFQIPMNKKQLSKNKISREMTFSDENNITTQILKSKYFGICSNEMITTYLINLFIFSEFTNPKNIEKNENVNVYYVLKNKVLDKFYFNSKDVLKHLNLSSDKENKIKQFFFEMNSYFKNNEYIELKNQNEKYRKLIKVLLIIIIIIFILSFIIFLLFFLQKNNNREIIIGIYIVWLIIIGFFLYIIINKLITEELFFTYQYILYMISKNDEINKIIDKWNKSDFESMRIHVSVPISLNYIQFNLDPFQNIEIKHINMEKIKNVFYPNNCLSEKNFEEFKKLKSFFKFYDNYFN